MMQYMSDDRYFEEHHNALVNRFNNYKNLPSKDKIAYASQIAADFEKIFQIAHNT